ncbi:MAG: MotA/TolQ/ExbB proton channel family protein [Lachnospiraceae bacterium]|nr:MotA/TolQ/ExbB proton channel family protein [Lachnospiraceae bacterium]
MSVISIILNNLVGYDLFILILGVLNGILYWYTRKRTMDLYNRMHQSIFIPTRKRDPDALAEDIRAVDEEEFVRLRNVSENLYGIFVNITAIFPLLGILGTVIALIPMVSQLADIQMNFFAALTSTFWGLVFAILFKVLDGFLSPRIDDNDKNVNLLLSMRPGVPNAAPEGAAEVRVSVPAEDVRPEENADSAALPVPEDDAAVETAEDAADAAGGGEDGAGRS